MVSRNFGSKLILCNAPKVRVNEGLGYWKALLFMRTFGAFYIGSDDNMTQSGNTIFDDDGIPTCV